MQAQEVVDVKKWLTDRKLGLFSPRHEGNTLHSMDDVRLLAGRNMEDAIQELKMGAESLAPAEIVAPVAKKLYEEARKYFYTQGSSR